MFKTEKKTLYARLCERHIEVSHCRLSPHYKLNHITTFKTLKMCNNFLFDKNLEMIQTYYKIIFYTLIVWYPYHSIEFTRKKKIEYI